MKIAGKNVPKGAVYGGGAVLLLGGVLYFRRKSSSASSGSSSSAIDPVTGLPYSQDSQTDPATGMTYLAEAQQYGSVAAAQAAVQGNYSSAGGTGGYGYVGTAGYPTSNVGPSSTPQGYATNSQWAQAVTAGLTGLGYTATDVAAALGLFFAQHPLPPNYASIIQAAEAEFGPPPQGTYAIIPEPSSGGGTGGSTASNPVSGLHQAAAGTNYVDIAWTAASGAKSYTIKLDGKVIHSGKDYTADRVWNLKAKHSYTVTVLAEPAASGAQPASLTIKTK